MRSRVGALINRRVAYQILGSFLNISIGDGNSD
jgi:hypothetical protein